MGLQEGRTLETGAEKQGNSFIAEESYSTSLRKMEREKKKEVP